MHDNDKYLGRSLIELGEFAEAQVEVFEHFVKPGMIVVDAGANIGAHTVVFAKLGAYVHAYEPQREMFHMLCANVAINGLRDVQCHHQALGNDPGYIGIPVMDTSQLNNLGAFQLDLEGDVMDAVEVVRLERRCDFLKVDVEGNELEVLKGARLMIEQCAPVLYVENDRKDKSEALLAFIRELGYTPYWHITDLDNPNNFKNSPPIFNCQSIDLLCAPPGVKMSMLPEAISLLSRGKENHMKNSKAGTKVSGPTIDNATQDEVRRSDVEEANRWFEQNEEASKGVPQDAKGGFLGRPHGWER